MFVPIEPFIIFIAIFKWHLLFRCDHYLIIRFNNSHDAGTWYFTIFWRLSLASFIVVYNILIWNYASQKIHKKYDVRS